MIDLFFELIPILGPVAAFVPWIFSIAWQEKKGRNTSRRRKIFGVWVVLAIILAAVVYVWSQPENPSSELWDYSGLVFVLYGILANFGLLGVGGVVAMFIPCPAKKSSA